MTEQEVNKSQITQSEIKELKRLRELQADHTRWLSQAEFDRIKELARKQLKQTVSPSN